ncbi:hypothetical protein D9611_002949 [Ephemerocybe angulata]|uniref:F-box domain-containing protein n=1 Tax=Ephemerocybe angulata TaxID=980116 RepID=A0A8H5C8C5_9AGAR|nr:hypothetical protein D9611_002949 [Tulosesus angulatus]
MSLISNPVEKGVSDLENDIDGKRPLSIIQPKAPDNPVHPLCLQSVPSEIMAEIFEHYMATSPSSNIAPSPYTLCLVCREWRDVVVGISSLWARLTVHLRYSKKWGDVALLTSTHASSVRTALKRIGASPWSLNPRFLPPSSDVDFSTLLTPASLKGLRAFKAGAEGGILGLKSLTFPSAESLVIESKMGIYAGLRHIQFEFEPHSPNFPTLPSLRKVVLGEIPLWMPLTTYLPWDQVTHLYVGNDVVFKELATILKICPNLRQACFQYSDMVVPDRHEYEAMEACTSVQLKCLTFIGGSPCGAPCGKFMWPNLLHLRLHEVWGRTWDPDSFKHCGTITHLHLSALKLSVSRQLGPLASSSKHLTHLYLEVKRNMEYHKIFRFFTFTPAKPAFPFPCLQVLGIHCPTPPTFRLARRQEIEEAELMTCSSAAISLTAMVSSRISDVHPQCTHLKRFIIRAPTRHRLVMRIVDTLEQFKDTLDLSLVIGRYPTHRTHIEGPGLRHWDDGFAEALDSLGGFL